MKKRDFYKLVVAILLLIVGMPLGASGQDESSVKVTFKMEYDQAKFMWPFEGVKIWNETMIPTAQFYMGMDIEASLAPDTYDMMSVFQTMEGGTPYFVIKEQVELKHDTTIVMSPDLATNYVSVKNYGPDGELLKLNLGQYDETGQWVKTESGNVAEYYVGTSVLFKDYSVSLLFTARYQFENATLEQQQTMSVSDFYVTDVSDRFLFNQTRIARTETLDKWYVSYYSTDDVKVGTMQNDPADYHLTQETMTYSPSALSKPGFGSGVYVGEIYDGLYLGGHYLMKDLLEKEKEGKTVDVTIYSNLPAKDACDGKLQLFTEALFHNNYTIEEYTSWSGLIYQSVNLFPVNGQPFTFKDGEKIYLNYGVTSDSSGVPIGLFFNTVEKTYGKELLMRKLSSIPNAYTYSESMKLGNYNDCCPILYYILNTINSSYGYVGRYGETIYYGADDPIKENNVVDGVHDITIENTDIEVDGLHGKNTAKIHYDENVEDQNPPSLMMLQFRRNDDCITDRFETGADGTMEFSAADFVGTYIPEVYSNIYTFKPAELTIEYSPYNEETWNPLLLDEDTDPTGTFGWGYFYRVSLKDVEGDAEKGWFDVRITMTDEVGNKQMQTISPAFRIDNMVATGVKSVNAGEKSVVARYGLDGKRVDALQKGINIVRLQNGEVRKAVVK